MKNKKETKVQKVLQALVEEAQDTIKGFAKELTEKDAQPAYTLEWQTQNVLFQSAMLRLAGGLLKAIQTQQKPPLELAEWRIQESATFLLGNDICAGPGPWRPNSTSPIANLMQIEEANAHRVLRAKLVEALAD